MLLQNRIMLGLILTAMMSSLYLIFVVVPTDVNLGVSQRIFYIHVPLAVLSLIPPIIVFITSILYLIRRSSRWDAIAHSSVEVGLLFTTLALITGSIWARPTWGVWWTWDPRLTTSTILWLMYVGYLMLRGYAPSREQGARYAAVMGIVAFVNVPIVYYSTVLWRTVHPEMVFGPASETGSLDSLMRAVLLFSTFTFTLLFVYLVIERLALTRVYNRVLSIRHKEGIY